MPSTQKVESYFRLAPSQVRALAKEFGTPLYVVDRTKFENNIRQYRSAFEHSSPGSQLIYATKANSTLAILQVALKEGLILDIASEGELRAALQAGAKPSQIHFHGSNKLASELATALKVGISQIIIDNFEEIDNLADLNVTEATQFVLRLAPGVDPITHEKISTGQADTKFGFSILDGSAKRALVKCRELQLPVIGFHCHVGSQLYDPLAQIEGGESIAQFAIEVWKELGFVTTYLNIGGGRATSGFSKKHITPVEEYCNLIVDSINKELKGTPLNPILAQEPGRSLIGEAGVTLYEIGVVKTLRSHNSVKTYISVDGGLSDNIRPGLYGADYNIEVVSRSEHDNYSTKCQVATIAGRHCETDNLFKDKLVPNEVKKGDYIQVFETGAYNNSMASNYNRFLKPAMVMIHQNGEPILIQSRQSWDQLFSNDITLDTRYL